MTKPFLSGALSILCLVFAHGSAAGQVELTSSRLPIIVIDTDSEEIMDDPRIVARMGIIYNGPGEINYISDPFLHYNGKISIEIRGSTSQIFPKKSYSFETQDYQGNNYNVPLLGLPVENDWVLYAPYSDKTLIRNILSYSLSGKLGQYAPRTRLCELILNGEYRGVYVLIEKIKRDKSRVDIATLDPEEISGDDLTGGYIIKVDKQTGNSGDIWFSRLGGIYFQYEYPEHDEITEEQKAYIKGFIDDFEASLIADYNYDPERGYRKYLDEASAIDLFIVSEIAKNIDSYILSSFFYKDKDSKGGKLVMGPLWDFNLAFANADYREGFLTQGLQLDIQMKLKGSIWWWKRLMKDPGFLANVKSRWGQVRGDQLSDQNIMAMVDSLTSLLEQAQQRNFQRWDILGREIWPNYYVGDSYADEISYLKNWTLERLHWLDGELFTWESLDEEEQVIQANVFPNPFSESFTYTFTLNKPASISLDVYDMNGRPVRSLIQGEDFLPGTHTRMWQAQELGSSIYLVLLKVNGKPASRKRIVKLGY